MTSKETSISQTSQRLSTLTAWAFMTPALILFSFFILWPMGNLVYLSFTSGSFTREGVRWIGLQNYIRLIHDGDFGQVVSNTIYFTIATVIPSVILPLGLAILLNQNLVLQKLKLQGLFRTAFFIPSITSLVATGLGFRWLFQTNGPVNTFIENIGVAAVPWLSSTVWAMPILILFSIWKQLGFNLVVFLAGLQIIPATLYEAAEIDGANGWDQFWCITLPSLRPTVIFAIITTSIFTLRSFEQVYVITGGGPLNSTNLLVYYIYNQAFGQFDFGYAAAAATSLLLVAFALVYCQLRFGNLAEQPDERV
ncbi:MAG: sugar ABC transporter permease [Synechococcales bacterium]|nr:sugar ABC transporter permease [Cyanobacteria bacterium REEB444]MEB3124914.1 sugar ABC transporter permease [Synechococcales bacterium]